MTTPQPSFGTAAFDPQPEHGPAATIRARISELQFIASRVPTASVIGPRGQHLTVQEALAQTNDLRHEIEMDGRRGSLRHHTVSSKMKFASVASLAIVDFPLMLWLTGSVFNVDWTNPFGAPIYLLISFVVATLATGGAASVLYHFGRNLRENKTGRRTLPWRELSLGSKASLLAVGFLVTLIAVVMYERVYTEGVQSGLNDLAVLLAILVAFVMLLTASLVFFTAFRDGSPKQEDLAFLSILVKDALQQKKDCEEEIERLRYQYRLLDGQLPPDFAGGPRRLPPA